MCWVLQTLTGSNKLWVANEKEKAGPYWAPVPKQKDIQRIPLNTYIFKTSTTCPYWMESDKISFIFPRVKLWLQILWQWIVPFKQDQIISAVPKPTDIQLEALNVDITQCQCHVYWMHSLLPKVSLRNLKDMLMLHSAVLWNGHHIQTVANRCLREQLSLNVIWREDTGTQRRCKVKQPCDFLMSNHTCAWTEPAESHTLIHTCVHRK